MIIGTIYCEIVKYVFSQSDLQIKDIFLQICV